MFVRTYGIVETVIDEAANRFGNRWVICQDRRNSLKTDCGFIDRLVSAFDCESAEADIDDDTLKLRIRVVCPGIVLAYDRTHPFFALIQRAESFRFSSAENSLRIDFVFADLLEKKDRGEFQQAKSG